MTRIYTGAVLASMLAASTAVMLPTAAHATLISIGDDLNGGAITTLATDGGSGFVQTGGAAGNFTLTSANATGAPLLPQPNIDTASIDISSTGAGTLYMFITEQGLTSPMGISNFLSSFTSNLINGAITSVVEKTFISSANALYSGTLLSTQTFTSAGTSSKKVAGPAISGVFSETIEYIISAAGVGDTNDTVNLSVPVPEPATFGLMAVGLSMLGFMALRRRSF